MLIVDSQIHAWAEGTSTGHHRRTPIDRQVLDVEMAGARVDRVVLVPPLWDPGLNDYSLELSRQDPDRFSTMGLLEPATAAVSLPSWHDIPGMRGARFLLNTTERMAPLLDGTLDAAWPAAQAAGVTVALLIPGGLHLVEDIARRHPRLALIVDHLGVPRGASGPSAFDHLPQLLALAALPNVHVKAAGVCDYAADPYPFVSLQAPLRRIFDAFGAQRIVWGSDLSRLHHPYAQCVTHFTEGLPWLKGTDLDAVMGGNILRLLGWS